MLTGPTFTQTLQKATKTAAATVKKAATTEAQKRLAAAQKAAFPSAAAKKPAPKTKAVAEVEPVKEHWIKKVPVIPSLAVVALGYFVLRKK
jgi:hypothetical protein